MKQISLFFAIVFFSINGLYAQIPDGSIAPDFTATDIFGNQHNLYEYLNAGKNVVIDFSTTNCELCWIYHETHQLGNFYEQFGPEGTDEVMVFLIESSEYTTSEDLYGTGSNTYGNWVEGTPYPIIDDASVGELFEVIAYPSIFMICHDKPTRLIGRNTTEELFELMGDCPPFNNNTNDVWAKEIKSPLTNSCLDVLRPEVTIMNVGSDALTSLTIKSFLDDQEMNTYEWTGNIAQYEKQDIILPAIYGISDGDHQYRFACLNPNGVEDENAADNEKSIDFNLIAELVPLSMDILTDGFGSYHTWELALEGEIILESPSYENTDGFPVHIYENFCLEEGACYELTFYSGYGGGININNNLGYISMSCNNEELFFISGDSYDYSHTEEFCVPAEALSIGNFKNYGLSVYPNPSDGLINISNNTNAELLLFDIMGNKILNKTCSKNNSQLDLTHLPKGAYILNVINDREIYRTKIIIK